MHNVIFYVHDLQQQRKDLVKKLKKIHVFIAHVQEWTMWYKGALLDLVKKMKPWADMEKVKVWMLIQNYEHLTHSSATYMPHMCSLQEQFGCHGE